MDAICSVCGIQGALTEITQHFNEHVQNPELEIVSLTEDCSDHENVDVIQAHNENGITWKQENIKLLSCYEDEIEQFQSPKKKTNKSVWKQIAEKMCSKGYVFTSEQCDLKFRNMKKTYKRIVDNNNQTGRGALSWPYFEFFDRLFGNKADEKPLSLISSTPEHALDETTSMSGYSSSSEVTVVGEPQTCATQPLVKVSTSSRKRKYENAEEPQWMGVYRKEVTKRQEQKMSLLKELIAVLKEK